MLLNMKCVLVFAFIAVLSVTAEESATERLPVGMKPVLELDRKDAKKVQVKVVNSRMVKNKANIVKRIINSSFNDLRNDDDRANFILKKLKDKLPNDKFIVAVNPGGLNDQDDSSSIDFEVIHHNILRSRVWVGVLKN